MNKKEFIVLVVISLFINVNKAEAKMKYGYGEKIKFENKKPLHFPDFSILFIGKTGQNIQGAKDIYSIYNFNVIEGKKKKAISWAAGGILVPTEFEVHGIKFCVELSQSIAFAEPLKENEFVIWKVSDFNRHLDRLSNGDSTNHQR